MIKHSTIEYDPTRISPNWSAFVLLVTLLSVFNVLTATLLPLPEDAKDMLTMVSIAISLILWADFAYLLRQSPDKRYFMTKQHGWMVLLGSVPLLRFLRIIWFGWALRKNGRSAREFLSTIVVKQSASGTLLFILFIVIVVFQGAVVFILHFEESSASGNIASISDAVWWAFATVTTVGYGDKYPVTDGGRIVATLLMAVGIALFSVITGSLAEWFSNRPSTQEPSQNEGRETGNADTIVEIRHLFKQQEEMYQQSIAALNERLSDLESCVKQQIEK